MHYPVRSMVTETNVRRTATRVGRLTVVQCSGGSKGKEGREGREGGKGRDLKGKEGRKRQMGREGEGREGKGRKVGCCCEAVSSTCRPEAEIKKKGRRRCKQGRTSSAQRQSRSSMHSAVQEVRRPWSG